MPKTFSEQERAYITKRLKEEAAKCIESNGFRRTTVDEIVRRVKIPKGTFYLFYQSKDLLLFDVILEQHNHIEQEMLKELGSLNPAELSVASLTNILFVFLKLAAETPLLKMLHSDEMEWLARKLPEGVVEEHFGHDHDMLEQIFAVFPVKDGIDTEAYSAAFRAIYVTTLHKEEIGIKEYDQALQYLIKGLVMQLF